MSALGWTSGGLSTSAVTGGSKNLMPKPIARLRQLCLALPDAWEKESHGEPTFWIGKSMFASFANAANHHGAGRHAVWCKASHVTQDLLVARAPDRYFRPPYVGPSGWIGIYLDRDPDWAEVKERLQHAYELAASPRLRRAQRRDTKTKSRTRRTGQ